MCVYIDTLNPRPYNPLGFRELIPAIVSCWEILTSSLLHKDSHESLLVPIYIYTGLGFRDSLDPKQSIIGCLWRIPGFGIEGLVPAFGAGFLA